METNGNGAFSYYPGCSLMATNRAYDRSTRNVAEALGLKLVELDDWNCCGATAYMAINEKRSFVMSARNLALAEKEDRDLVTVCNGCYLALKKTNKYLTEDSHLQADIQRALVAGDMNYAGGVKVLHFLEVVVNDLGEEIVRKSVTQPLTGLKVACYYGCQFSRPFGEIDHEEFPEMMDKLVGWLGAEPVPFPLKAKCCGGMMMTTEPEIGLRLSGQLLKNAKDAGADCLISACPLCQMNLEGYQKKSGAEISSDCSLPVLYFTQLLGVAFGLSSKKLALKDSLTPVETVFAERIRVA